MVSILKVLNFLSLKRLLQDVYCYENNLVYPVHITDQKFEDHVDLLLTSDKNKSNYVYIKDFKIY